MANNVVLASGALTVATQGDADNVQTQKVVGGFLTSAGLPLSNTVQIPLPVDGVGLVELMAAILIELRVQNELAYSQVWTETEPLELLREKYKAYPVTTG